MSRNFELLQRAQRPFVEEPPPSAEGQPSVIKLPATELPPTEKNGSAKHSQVVLFRRVSPDRYEAKLINVKQKLKIRDLSEDSHLKPGDTLFLPQSYLPKIRQFVPNPGIGLGKTF